MAEHTELPWRIDKDRWWIVGPDGVSVAECFGQLDGAHNAELIVRAVNHHAELVACVQGLLGMHLLETSVERASIRIKSLDLLGKLGA